LKKGYYTKMDDLESALADLDYAFMESFGTQANEPPAENLSEKSEPIGVTQPSVTVTEIPEVANDPIPPSKEIIQKDDNVVEKGNEKISN
jgi:hypothetical protein